MSAWLAATPLLVPLATALACLALSGKPRAQRAASVLGATALLAAAVAAWASLRLGTPLVARFGGWSAPFAIEFRLDGLAVLMICMTALLQLTTTVWSSNDTLAREAALRHLGVAAACSAYATADLFNLYVWFEVLLVTSVALVLAGGQRHHLTAAMKYLTLSILSTCAMLMAIGGIYGTTGHLNYSALGAATAQLGDDPLTMALLVLLVTALLAKAAAVPFHFWMTSSYPLASIPTAALFTGLTNKVAAVALLRLTTTAFPAGMATLAPFLGSAAAIAMLVGVLGAMHHYDLRRILAFHSVSQIGYILMAIALGGTVAPVAAAFFIVHHALVKGQLYLIAGMIARQGSFDLRHAGGLLKASPPLAVLFGLGAAALVGFPPTTGFWAKLMIVQGGLAAHEYAWTAVLLLTGLLTLISMTKVWNEAFWKPTPTQTTARPATPRREWLATVLLAAVTAAVSLHPGPVLSLLGQATGTLP
jgi:multicomponent Na+:H+ antiporter subunit D